MAASKLFSTASLRSLTARNRIVVSPMCQYSCEDGLATPWHLVHLGSRAVGGAGIVIVEATAVTPEARISPHDMGIWSDRHVEALAPIAKFIREQGAIPGIQLAHAGRKGSTHRPWSGHGAVPLDAGGWVPVAPSDLAYNETYPKPRALTTSECAQVVEQFAAAAQRALAAGFELIELHSAHGYLLHQFLSPLSNRRDDTYGGSLENRERLTLEVARAVRKVWPEKLPLWTRLSATDWVDRGWALDDTVHLARGLKEAGVDAIDCSSGGLDPRQKIVLGPGYQAPFAERVKHMAQIPTVAVGLITDAAQAEDLLAENRCDFVALAREMLRDPYWPMHAAQQLDVEVKWPVQYERAKPT